MIRNLFITGSLLWLCCTVGIIYFGMASQQKHVVVVGAGLAGLSASIEAATGGAKVTLIEGEKNIGGNSAKASSGINGCGTEAQKKMQINDSLDRFYSDTMKSGDNENEADLVDLLTHDSAGSVAWLMSFGVDLTDINWCGGHTVARTHWIPSPKEGKPKPVGFTIIRALKDKVDQLQANNPEHFTLMTNTKVTELLTDGNAVTGVKALVDGGEATDIMADSVVLTTGGFSNDHTEDSLLQEFAPEKLKYPTTNGPFAAGTGVKMARKIGAKLIHMNYVQIHPTGFVDPKDPPATTKFLAAEALRGSGAVLLNDKGERFANELGRRDYLTDQILKNCPVDQAANAHTAWLVMNTAGVDKFGWPAFNFYWKIKGFFQPSEGYSGLAQLLSVDESVVSSSLEGHNEAMDGKKQEPFGKSVFPVKFGPTDTYYAARITPSIHYTMGGVKISGKGRVYGEKSNKEIRGLLAAGEVTGGVHGRNRLAGNSLLECVVFGRIAGRTAAGR